MAQGEPSFTSAFSTLAATASPELAGLGTSHLPGFLPTFITDAIAQSEHGIHMVALPMHASSFEAGFDDEFVGTFHHTRPNRPACSSERGILHQSQAFAQIPQVLTDVWAFSKLGREALGHAQKGVGTAMLEDM